LQMVASLLNLHSRQLKGHPAAEALLEGKYRVEALTLIHQKLYRDDIDTKIDLKDYIEELTKNLVMNFGQNFDMELKLVPFIMKIDKAIPLGLVLNELVTNSLKYGQEDNESPKLAIVITKEAENVILTIKDNGKGLPDDFDFRKTDSFGLKLVHSLINQLGGKIDWNSKSGTCWTITLNTLKIS
ncbi:MAG: sensor histidine kinase, partial [Prolixibacteraceae bacterium]|nr:sensor histidine kinase [Prolixibacteraceae bacterium]